MTTLKYTYTNCPWMNALTTTNYFCIFSKTNSVPYQAVWRTKASLKRKNLIHNFVRKQVTKSRPRCTHWTKSVTGDGYFEVPCSMKKIVLVNNSVIVILHMQSYIVLIYLFKRRFPGYSQLKQNYTFLCSFDLSSSRNSSFIWYTSVFSKNSLFIRFEY